MTADIAIQRLLQDLIAQYPVRGAFLTGSYARGQQQKTSDIDLFVLIDAPWRQKLVRHYAGFEFELFLNPAWQIEREIAQASAENASTLFILQNAQTLLDPHGEVERLRILAAARLQAGPTPLPPWRREILRYALTDLVKDADDAHAAADLPTYRYLAGIALDQACAAYFTLRDRWAIKPKHRLPTLCAELAPARAWVEAIHQGDITALYALADLVLAPAGGLVRGDWELPVDNLTPP